MSAFDVGRFPLNIASPPADGKRRPAVVILHGNFGLSKDYAGRLIRFRDRLASSGYLAAVPRYYPDDLAHPDDRDPEPHVATVAAAIEEIAACPGADPDRMALVGYSLGGGIAMSYLIDHAPERMKAFVDFFGYYKQGRIPEGARLPPTAIFHDRSDGFVPFRLSLDLIRISIQASRCSSGGISSRMPRRAITCSSRMVRRTRTRRVAPKSGSSGIFRQPTRERLQPRRPPMNQAFQEVA